MTGLTHSEAYLRLRCLEHSEDIDFFPSKSEHSEGQLRRIAQDKHSGIALTFSGHLPEHSKGRSYLSSAQGSHSFSALPPPLCLSDNLMLCLLAGITQIHTQIQPAQGPKFPLGGWLNQGPVEVGATPSPWQQCPEGGVQRPSSSTDFSRSCERGQSRIVLFLYRQRQQTHGSVPLRASKLDNLIREKRSSGYHLPEID